MSAPRLSAHRGGSGEPLVLIHGIGHAWQAWLPVLPMLEERHEVLALDLPGFGHSPPLAPGVAPTAEALADAVERELDAAGLDSPHVAGNSLGGRIGIELAGRGRARSVVALSPAGLSTPREAAYERAFLRLTHALARFVPEAALGPLPTRVLFGAGMFGRPWRLDPAQLAEQAELLARSPGFAATLDELHASQPQGLTSLERPVLVAWGTRDRLLQPRQAKRWGRLVPGAEVRYLDGLGHIPMTDDPDLVARTILEWTARSGA